MRKIFNIKIIRIVIVVAIVGFLGVVFTDFGSGRHADIAAQSTESITAEKLVERGRLVAIASDCIACHTEPGEADFAGGLHFSSPFGDMYSTNITPDKDYGIGNYTREDFFRAVKYGYSSQTGNLYPAMPYTSYRKLSDEDTESLWAYFRSIRPVAKPNRENNVIFPANIRFGLGAWNQLFFEDSNFEPNVTRSEVWNRGKYLVEAPGHCGECHTPRNIAFAMKSDAALQGEVIEGWDAEDITKTQLKAQGWTPQELSRLFSEGYSSLGTTYAGMYTVVDHSLSKMAASDLTAISAYLLDEDEIAATPEPIESKSRRYLTADQKAHDGFQNYVNYCAGCHGYDGLGQPNGVVALNNNSEYSSDSTYNAIAVILRGLPSKRQNLTRGSVAMPGFGTQLSDAEIAAVVNFAKAVWTGTRGSNVQGESVRTIRQQLEEDGYIGQDVSSVNSH